jgi:SAM-dependent methyltransferase
MPSHEEVRRWYNQQYAEKTTEAMRPFEAYLPYLDTLGVRTGATLLDVSCGTGYLLLAASQRGLVTAGIDLSQEAVQVAREVTPQSHIILGTSDALGFADGTFDYVTCLGSLEHYPDKDKALSEIRRVAKEDALFCITVPNSDFILWQLFRYGTEQQDIIETPMRLGEWMQLFGRNGFRVLKAQKERWYLKRARFLVGSRLSKILERELLRLLWISVPLKYTYQFEFILRRSPVRPQGDNLQETPCCERIYEGRDRQEN